MEQDGPIDGQHFLSLVGDTNVTDQLPTVRLTDLEQHSPKVETPSSDQAAAGTGPGEADPTPPPTPIKIPVQLQAEDHGRYNEPVPVQIHVVIGELHQLHHLAAPRPRSTAPKTPSRCRRRPPLPLRRPLPLRHHR